MAITCLKPSSPPNPNPSSHLSKATTTLVPWVGTSRQSKCMTTAVCIVLGSSVGFADGVSIASTAAVLPPEAKAVQWRDKRKCPPWDNNYLDRSMRENLPRPFARGKNNRGAVENQEAPPPAATPPLVKHDTRCFSL